MPNRKERPPIHTFQQIKLPFIQQFDLGNGVPVYVVNQGTQEVIKLEVLFDAGRPYETKPLVSRVTAALMREGSKLYSSAQLAEYLDFYGSSLKAPVDMDAPSLVLYTLNKHLPKVLPLLKNLVMEPAFHELEMMNFIERQCQRMDIELSKPEVLAYRAVTEKIFGESHPYGYNSTADLFWDLERSDIIRHYERCYQPASCKMILSGHITEKEINVLQETFAEWKNQSAPVRPVLPEEKHQAGAYFLPANEAAQTAYRLGVNLVERKHEDYSDLYVVNTLLGGYFGSRLMTNIREDKGYTYNIYSSLDCMRFAGCWLISSEVGNEFTQETRTEVLREIMKLREEPVDHQELEMLKNYLQGVLLGMLDGPFNIGEVVKNIIVAETDLGAFERVVRSVQKIQPERILELFNKYFKPEQFTEVWVGPEKSLNAIK
jgi:predicted Zn-dependent peptidase